MAFKKVKNIIFGLVRSHLNQAFYTILTIKLHLGNNYKHTTNIISKSLLTLLIALIAIVLIPLGFLFYYFISIYKLIVIFLIKIYLRSKYEGFPTKFGAPFVIGRATSKQIINYIIAIEENEKNPIHSPEDVFLKLKKQLQVRVDDKNIPRLFCVCKRYFGYEFYKKESFDINDYLRQFDITDKDTASREDLQKAFDIIINNPLPKNNLATWEALISKQLVDWMNNCQNIKHHVILFRLYHAIGDASCGNKIMHALFADFGTELVSMPTVKVTSPVNKAAPNEEATWNVFKHHTKHRRDIRKKSRNVLYNPKMSFHRNGAWVIEEDKKYVQMIKDIKNRRKDLTFNTVAIAAVSLSLSKFCQKRGQSTPDSMPLIYAINTKPEDLGTYEATDLESIKYENNLAWAQIKIPIICDKNRNFNKKSDVLYLLNRIELEVGLFKKSRDLQMQTWFSEEIIDRLPIPLIEHMMKWENPAFDLSNLPGNKEFTILGNKVTDIIFFTPDMTKFSIGFSCTTYNGRLQLGAMADDATFSSKDVREILNGLIESLELLNKATMEK